MNIENTENKTLSSSLKIEHYHPPLRWIIFFARISFIHIELYSHKPFSFFYKQWSGILFSLHELNQYPHSTKSIRFFFSNSNQLIDFIFFPYDALPIDTYSHCSWAADYDYSLRLITFIIMVKCSILWWLDLPSKVTISGPSEARLYQTIVLKCVTRPGNPAPRLVWLVEDNVTQASTINTESDGNNAWIVTSTLNFAITSRVPVIRTFTCKTEGFPTGDSVSDQHKVSVICE